MKKIAFYSEESLFSGNIKCGIAEVVDSLANSLASEYEVSIICKQGNLNIAETLAELKDLSKEIKYGRFLKVDYYLVDSSRWPEGAIEILNDIQPDVIHNFNNPDLISKLNFTPKKAVYTFDDVNYLVDKESYLKDYDFITTFSKGYHDLILEKKEQIVETLKGLSFEKVSIGISAEAFTPTKGLLLPAPYSGENQENKDKCKERLQEKFNIPKENFICLLMARLVREKGLENIIKAVPLLKEKGATLIVVGKGEKVYEEFFTKTNNNKEVIYINNQFSPAQVIPFMGGADFYLQPSLMESGGIMPMIASQYGAIPIVTLNGGLADNFNDDNAIIVRNNDVSAAIIQASDLYSNTELLYKKRECCMSQDYSWNTRKRDFIKLYEG